LPKKIKKLAEYMLSDIQTVDLSIYSANRAFRAMNSRHATTGLYKIGITYEELMGDLDYILILAEEPRQHEFVKQSATRRANPKLTEAWAYVSSITDNEDAFDKESGGGLDPEHEGFFTPANEGDRNNKLFKQACMLFDKSELSFSHVHQLMSNANAASPAPLTVKELYTLVRSAEQRTKSGKATFTGTGRTWFTLGEQAQEIMDSMSKSSGQYSTSFPSFDKVLEGDLKGKMLVIAGQGGTRKSILAQQMLFYNVIENGMRGIYNNQEMSKSQWLQRGVNMLAGGSYITRQAWQALKEEYERDREAALVGLNSFLKTDQANRVIVDYRMATSTSYYRKVIDEVEKASGRIDMLVVDGLSMMDDKGGETDSAAQHTRELKQLANELDIFVVVLVHVTKDISKHTRDLMRALRGSGKIYDNGDIFISCSLCVDQQESTDDDLIYRTDIGYLRLFDKRESGKTINVIYELDPIAMRMRETDIVPSFVEIKVKEDRLVWKK
jgi:KaiC/GvpD/RAD55 family RecA-like ATPase